MKIKSKILPLIIVVILLLMPCVSAADTVIIDKSNPENSKTFEVESIKPGEVEIENYSVTVNYKGKIDTCFAVKVKEGYEEIGKILKCKISIPDEKLLYDGYISEVPTLVRTMETTKAVSEVVDYSVVVYFDEKEEYDDLQFAIDLVWWVDEDNGELMSFEETKNVSTPFWWCFLIILLLIGVLYYLAGW